VSCFADMCRYNVSKHTEQGEASRHMHCVRTRATNLWFVCQCVEEAARDLCGTVWHGVCAQREGSLGAMWRYPQHQLGVS
jgi:hypothetical protein